MKLKNIITAAALAAVLAFGQACNKPFEFDRVLALSSNAVTLSSAAGSTHVMVYSDGAWTAEFTEPVKWASLNKTSGEGINDIVFSYSANYAVSRQVGIVFTSGYQRDTVMMTQKGSITEASMLFDNSSLTLLRAAAEIKCPFSTNLRYGLDNIKYSVTYSEELSDEEEAAEVEEWISDISISTSAVRFSVSENESGLPRVAYVRLEVFDPAQDTSNPVNAALVVTQTAADPVLSFSETSMSVAGYEGSYTFETLTNNVWPYADKVEVESDAEWIGGFSLNSKGFDFKVDFNGDGSQRIAHLTVSFSDSLGNSVSLSLSVSQEGYPAEMSMEELMALAGTSSASSIPDFKYVEGYIVSDAGSPNIVSNPQTAQFVFDRDYNYRNAYLQTKDGRLGIRLLFDDAESAAIARYTRVRILLTGLSISKESDPDRYTLSGLNADSVFESEAGDVTAIVPKNKTIAELTDSDIYTLVRLKNVEVLFKDGAYTNATDGYSFKDDVNPFSGTATAPRWDVAPLLCTDNEGSVAYMLTNTACSWRRGLKDLAFNALLPQGSGVFNAVIVHEEQPTVRYGDLGRYQLRYMSDSDLELDKDPFSKTIVEWNWNDRQVNAVPEIGSGTLYYYNATFAAGADFNNTYNGRSGDGGNGGATSNQKGLVTNGAIKLTNYWWDFTADEGNYFDVIFSTAGLSGTNLIFGIAWNHGSMNNTTLDGPAHWKLRYSVDGGVNFKDVPDCEIIKNRSITWWTTTSQDSCPGFKDHLRRLPLECFGCDKVVVRVQVADKVTDINPSPKAVTDNSYLNFLGIEKGTLTNKQTECRIGTITVRYN